MEYEDDDMLLDDEDIPSNPEEKDKIDNVKKENVVKKEEKGSIVLNIENIEEVLHSFKYATEELKKAQTKIQNVDVNSNINELKKEIQKASKNGVEILEEELKKLNTKAEVEEIMIQLEKMNKAQKVLPIEQINNIVFELETSKDLITEAAQSKNKMISISILLTALICSSLAFAIGYFAKEKINEREMENRVYKAIQEDRVKIQNSYLFYSKKEYTEQGLTSDGRLVLQPIEKLTK